MSSNIRGRKAAKIALSYDGAKTGSRKHKALVDTFNKLEPNGQVAGYKDYWCAIAWTAWQIKAGMSHDDVPMGYNVPQLVSQAKDRKIWVSAKGYTPRPGDGIVFDWNGNNSGDHIGMVYKADDDYVYTIEGNKGDAGTCGRRKLSKKNGTILGYICPKYNAIYIDFLARRYAWPKGTEKKKYAVKTGKPCKRFRNAWKKHFPKRKIGSGCHQYVMLVMRVAGYKVMPLKWDSIISYMKKRCTSVAYKGNTSQLRKGDIFIYRRIADGAKKYHIFFIVDVDGRLMIAEANQNRYYAHINSSLKKTTKTYDKVWLFRPREAK